MNDSEINAFKRLLREALDTRMLAAELYVAALEYGVPLVHGDDEIVRGARRMQSELAAWVDPTLAGLDAADADDIAETLKKFVG